MVMSDNLIQVGVCAIRGPDGRVIKDAPLFLPGTKYDAVAEKDAQKEFARVATKKMLIANGYKDHVF